MKPIISLTLKPPYGKFQKNNVIISDEEAEKIWEEGSADWTQGAFRRMAQLTMKENVKER